jgi:hypothetical protein
MSEKVVCLLRVPEEKRIANFIRENRKHCNAVVTQDSNLGESVTICGAGPSLREYKGSLTNQVWACNSALPYMMKQGHRVTHGFTIDSGIEMVGEWKETFDVEYLIASSVNPELVNHLSGQRTRFFHSFIGIDGEALLYSTYPTSLQAGHGLNSVPRAVCIALGMGFRRIEVYGADCGVPDTDPMPDMESPEYGEWMDRLVIYADGKTAGEAFTHNSPMAECPDLEGRRWTTRPDMIVSAVHLLELQAAFPGRIELKGDTLPAVLSRQTPEWMSGMPTLNRSGEMTGFGLPTGWREACSS